MDRKNLSDAIKKASDRYMKSASDATGLRITCAGAVITCIFNTEVALVVAASPVFLVGLSMTMRGASRVMAIGLPSDGAGPSSP